MKRDGDNRASSEAWISEMCRTVAVGCFPFCGFQSTRGSRFKVCRTKCILGRCPWFYKLILVQSQTPLDTIIPTTTAVFKIKYPKNISLVHLKIKRGQTQAEKCHILPLWQAVHVVLILVSDWQLHCLKKKKKRFYKYICLMFEISQCAHLLSN